MCETSNIQLLKIQDWQLCSVFIQFCRFYKYCNAHWSSDSPERACNQLKLADVEAPAIQHSTTHSNLRTCSRNNFKNLRDIELDIDFFVNIVKKQSHLDRGTLLSWKKIAQL